MLKQGNINLNFITTENETYLQILPIPVPSLRRAVPWVPATVAQRMRAIERQLFQHKQTNLHYLVPVNTTSIDGYCFRRLFCPNKKRPNRTQWANTPRYSPFAGLLRRQRRRRQCLLLLLRALQFPTCPTSESPSFEGANRRRYCTDPTEDGRKA